MVKKMNRYQVHKSILEGELTIPSSKSQTLRAILFAALAEGKSLIYDYLPSPDTRSMIAACQSLGAHITSLPHELIIEGNRGKIAQAEDVINAGNSGLVLRMIAAVSALASKPIVITGDYSIRHQRPMKPLLEALNQLGISAISTRGDTYAPVIIQGPFKGGKASFCGMDSQHVSAMLIASAFSQEPVELFVTNPGEKPWISLTLSWFAHLNIPYENHQFEHYRIKGNHSYKGFIYHVPGDLSSVAFPIAAALITRSQLLIKNVDMQDAQGDKLLIEILREMGASITVDDCARTLFIDRREVLKGIEVDVNPYIDALPILAVIAAFSEGEMHIRNAAVARHKECDRIHHITKELQKMGALITEHEDGLTIRTSQLKGAHVNSQKDHRLAMALTIAGMGAEGKTIVNDVDCITKTYPSFFQDFKALGVSIQLESE
jgi:3-phosphoshikimate 1-carboxyvinyltransferase